ncbi:hypothetical protein CR513_23645, partial [Mucuna pruriens]
MKYQRQEKVTLVPQQIESSKPEVNALEDDNDSKEVIDNMPATLRKGKRSCIRYTMYSISQFHRSFITTIDAIKIPALVQEAIKDSNWVQAMREEIKTLERNSTWDIVDKPKDKELWVAATHLGWDLQQFDVKNAFMHGDLEEVYMEIFPRFESHSVKNIVCKLKKAFMIWKIYSGHDLPETSKVKRLPVPKRASLSPKGNMCLIFLRRRENWDAKPHGCPLNKATNKIGSEESPPIEKS